MILPNYKFLKLKNFSQDHLSTVLNDSFNLKHPVVLVITSLSRNEQIELINFVENYFKHHNLSLKYPYPVFFISKEDGLPHESLVFESERKLPRFFSKKDAKVNLKDSHQILKNRLIQLEIKNTDSKLYENRIKKYAQLHKNIYELEKERVDYEWIHDQLLQTNKEN